MPHPPSPIRRSAALLGAVRTPVAVSVALGLVVAALPFVANVALGPLMQTVADAGMTGNLTAVWDLDGSLLAREGAERGWLGWLATPLPFAVLLVLWAGALVAAQLFGFAKSWIDARVSWRLQTEVRQRVHDHLQTLSLDFFTAARSGALMQRVQVETNGVKTLVTDCLLPPAVDVVVLVIALAYLVTLSWQMTVIALLLAPAAFVALRFVGARLQAATRQMVARHRTMGAELEETLSSIAEIQVFNAQDRRGHRFHDASQTAAKSMSTMLVWNNAGITSTQVFIALSTVVVLVAGVTVGGSFGLTFAALVVFVGFVPTMFAAVGRIANAYTAYHAVIPNVVATYELLDTEPTVRERPDAVALGEVRGNLVFSDVAFSYSPSQKILDGLSFSIAEGETVALVGPIGCGKSTVFNLLMRFLDPQRGRITLDGNDISVVTLASLREQVSKLAQFPVFTKGTIRENVRMGRHSAADHEVEQACELAHIHSVIVDPAKIADGYDTVIDAQMPSGGQKRLIALARCLLRQPEVLLLDEPTEHLDADQRGRLTRVIREYARERTCMVISHDLDFVAAVADRIIVLDGGRAVADGSHEQLMAAGGLYRRLYEAQNVDPALVRHAGATVADRWG
ncbi:ABC transporter ATP-binding protein [Mycolicibacterium sp.]|uniref:ABC transporter ATP-binding protein n=1 Tax=Mycolicibacterium sp. TaxID=2320850 RepID=UPI003D0DC54C